MRPEKLAETAVNRAAKSQHSFGNAILQKFKASLSQCSEE
jgi:hypothetical protein